MEFRLPDRPRQSPRSARRRSCRPLMSFLVGIPTALALFALAAIAVSAGNTPPPSQIRVNTRLVKIGVIAHDKNGPVANLTKKDFVVVDRGKERKISFFSADGSGPASPAHSALPSPQNTFSDLPQRGGAEARSVTVILLDNLNTLSGTAPLPYEDTPFWLEDHALANAKQHLIEFLKHADPNDRIAIYGLARSLHVLCDFTCDRDQLLAVVGRYDATSITLRELAEPGDFHVPFTTPEFNAEVDSSAAAVAAMNNRARVQTTLDALAAIAGHLADVPGRKNLLWLTANLPFSGHAIARILSRANIAAYPVDARGLLPRSAQETKEGEDDQAAYLFGSRGGPPAMSAEPIGIGAMQDMADDTGGRAFVNTNDLTSAIRKVVEDSAITYTLGFYIDRESIDGTFHELRIALKRKGVTIRYPKGYFAFEDIPATKDENRDNLRTALRSPIESSAIPLQVRIDRVEKPLPHCLSIFGSIDIHNLRLSENGGVRKGGVEVVTIEQDRSGKVVAQSASTISFRLSDKEYADYLKSGFPFHQYVQPSPDAATLRILVEDLTAAEVGSLIIPLSQVR
jgi:VWFA-related protein